MERLLMRVATASWLRLCTCSKLDTCDEICSSTGQNNTHINEKWSWGRYIVLDRTLVRLEGKHGDIHFALAMELKHP